MSKKIIYNTSYPSKVITEQEQPQEVANEPLMLLINDEVEFLTNLAGVLSQSLPVDRRNQILRLLQDRTQNLTRVAQVENRKPKPAKQPKRPM